MNALINALKELFVMVTNVLLNVDQINFYIMIYAIANVLKEHLRKESYVKNVNYLVQNAMIIQINVFNALMACIYSTQNALIIVQMIIILIIEFVLIIVLIILLSMEKNALIIVQKGNLLLI